MQLAFLSSWRHTPFRNLKSYRGDARHGSWRHTPFRKQGARCFAAVYLQSRHLSHKVRVFVDWVAELFAACPLLGGSAMPLDQKCKFACDQKTNHEYTIRTLVEQHNIAEARALKT